MFNTNLQIIIKNIKHTCIILFFAYELQEAFKECLYNDKAKCSCFSENRIFTVALLIVEFCSYYDITSSSKKLEQQVGQCVTLSAGLQSHTIELLSIQPIIYLLDY